MSDELKGAIGIVIGMVICTGLVLLMLAIRGN